MRALFSLGMVALAATATPAFAAAIDAGVVVQGRVGAGTNPYLVSDGNSSALLAGIRITPTITARTATSTSTLSGFGDYTGYSTRYGHSDAYGFDARHQAQIDPALQIVAHAGYLSSLNALTSPLSESDIDEVTIGSRRRRAVADLGLTYQASARDTFSLQGNYEHASYNAAGLSNYDEYGGTFGYSRTLSENTQVGLQLLARRLHSQSVQDTTSFQPAVTLKQKFSTFWTLDAHVGAIIQKSELAGLSLSSTTIGFGANLCRADQRTSLCFDASRDTAGSGLGGLRTETRGSVEYNYQLSERSHFQLGGTYGRSKVTGFSLASNQDFAEAHGNYDRRLTERVSLGASLNYRRRMVENLPDADGVEGSLNVTAKFGRTS